MDENNRTIHISSTGDAGDFALEDILAEYRHVPGEAPEEAAEAPAEPVQQPDAEIPAAPTEPEPEPPTAAEETPEAAVSEAAPEEAAEEDAPQDKAERWSKKELFMFPVTAVTALLALIALRRSQRPNIGDALAQAEKEKKETLPEPTPEQAARYYAGCGKSFRFRSRVAAVLSLVMIYLSFAYCSALPLTGALTDHRCLSLMLLILELSVMLCGLDLLTDGILSLVRRKPNGNSLAAVSCVLSVLDALALILFRDDSMGLPFCAVSAISMTFALLGSRLLCGGIHAGLRVVNSGKNLSTVSGETGLSKENTALLRSRRSPEGFVRRSEAEDYATAVFRKLTPVLLAAAVVLGVLSGLLHRTPKTILHSVSMLAAAASAFSVGLCYALPYALTARRFAGSGAAVAGWPGIRDIGRSRHVVLTDGDVFPRGSVELGDVRVLENIPAEQVIGYTGSVIAAAGSGLAAPFGDLLRRNGCTFSRVEDFTVHDGGGMTAVVNGDSVSVGCAGFMNLMGVRVPQKLSTRNNIYTAVNGRLVGIFTAEYHPSASVQASLVALQRSELEPLFAVRDFNVTPLMVQDSFRMNANNLKFPAFAERFRISGAVPDGESRVAAVLIREGMEALAEVSERGQRLYRAIRLGTLVSAAGCIFGLLLMFLLSWTSAFSADTVKNAITFMLLWLVPTAVIAWGVQR